MFRFLNKIHKPKAFPTLSIFTFPLKSRYRGGGETDGCLRSYPVHAAGVYYLSCNPLNTLFGSGADNDIIGKGRVQLTRIYVRLVIYSDQAGFAVARRNVL